MISDTSILAAIGGPLIGVGCFVVAGRLARPKAARPAPAPRPVAEPVPTTIVVREPSASQPGGLTGTLVLCDSPQAVAPVVAMLSRRLGTGVEAARSVEAALVALRQGASAAVCGSAIGRERLQARKSWPATIELGETFFEADRLSSEDAESELERALQYLDAIRRRRTATETAGRAAAGPSSG